MTAKAGLGDPTSKSLGVAVIDIDGDGWPDLFVCNDTQPNKLYRNNHNGTFSESGMTAGVAYGEDGVARGAMGVDWADYDRSGRAHLLVGNFSNQMLGLYHNEGNGLFVDEAPTSTVGRESLLSLTFGVFFFDYDLDGYPDILTANGHIEEEIGRVQPKIHYQEPPLLFRNLGARSLRTFRTKSASDFPKPMVARGAIYGDYDHDGDLDVLITANNGPAHLFRNDGGNKNHWLSMRTRGTKSNRDGIGAVVRIESASGKQWSTVHSGSSYASQSDLALTFGIGQDPVITSLQVEWPSGTKQSFANVQPNQAIIVDEAKGILPADVSKRLNRPVNKPEPMPLRAMSSAIYRRRTILSAYAAYPGSSVRVFGIDGPSVTPAASDKITDPLSRALAALSASTAETPRRWGNSGCYETLPVHTHTGRVRRSHIAAGSGLRPRLPSRLCHAVPRRDGGA